MKDKPERRSKATGMLLGPKSASKWVEWRKSRDNAIAKPRRLKTVKDNARE